MSDDLRTCNTHPEAPHGFDRNASHADDRYVCDCESWTAPTQQHGSRTSTRKTTMPDDPMRKKVAQTAEAHGLGWIDYGRDTARCYCGHRPRLGESWHWHLADAVIRELGLRQEWAVADSDGDHVYVGAVEEKADRYTIQPGDHKQTRYVTEWENDE